MLYCPSCHSAYSDDLSECFKCGEDLVEDCPPLRAADREWVVLKACSGPIFAEMIKGVLDDEQIPCLLIRDFIASAYGSAGTGQYGMQSTLHVPKYMLTRAENLVAQLFADGDADADMHQ